MVSTPKIKCNRHGYPPGEHENYFNGNCIWCLIEDRNGLQAKNDTLMRDLKSCHESKTKFGDKIMELRIEIDRLTKLGEERHIRAKNTEEHLMAHIEAIKAENERLSEALEEIENTWPLDGENAYLMADTAKAALRREVDGGKD